MKHRYIVIQLANGKHRIYKRVKDLTEDEKNRMRPALAIHGFDYILDIRY